MQIRREKIRQSENDINLKIGLSRNNDFLGYQQQIDRLLRGTGEELINPENDLEIRRFAYENNSDRIRLRFYLSPGNYQHSFITGNIFTETEYSRKVSNVLNSFFILELYDDFNLNTQNRLQLSYLTKISYNNYGNTNNSEYVISDTQFNRINLPINFLEQQEDDTIIGYVRFSFFNAKNGKLKLFENVSNLSKTTPEKFHFPVTINLNTNTWVFNGTSPIIGREYTGSQEYLDKLNETLQKFDNQLETYPTGNTFNFGTGKYIVI